MDLSTIALTAYVLVWPVIVAGTLTVIVRAFVAEARKAKAEGRSII
ncbi:MULTISPECIES: putative transporter small subunit [Microbacterium]|nr:putative transporter small subunit [Microbacterium esteraromaticum]